MKIYDIEYEIIINEQGLGGYGATTADGEVEIVEYDGLWNVKVDAEYNTCTYKGRKSLEEAKQLVAERHALKISEMVDALKAFTDIIPDESIN